MGKNGAAPGGGGCKNKKNNNQQSSRSSKASKYMSKHDLNDMSTFASMRQFSAITEESVIDETHPWDRKHEEMEIVESIIGDDGNFTVVETPSETECGQFRVQIEPNCGMDLSGCNIEI